MVFAKSQEAKTTSSGPLDAANLPKQRQTQSSNSLTELQQGWCRLCSERNCRILASMQSYAKLCNIVNISDETSEGVLRCRRLIV